MTINELTKEIHENAVANTKRLRDLSGLKFGRLTAIADVGSERNRRMWLCRCECGNDVVVASSSLRLGNTKSCGCITRDGTAQAKHGYCGTRLYRIWKGIKSRCNILSSTDYKWYGAKGVSVCGEWSEFEPFKEWALKNGYSDNLTIDRIDPFGNYEPSNCRWATTAQQNMNQRRNAVNGQIN